MRKVLALAALLFLGGCLEAVDLVAETVSGPRTCPTPDGGVEICDARYRAP
jgi:hypothetical protein